MLNLLLHNVKKKKKSDLKWLYLKKILKIDEEIFLR